jgi:hypothetical protein
MQMGLHALLGVSPAVKIYLDNGAYYFLGRDGETPRQEYAEFVALAKPDWWPIPQNFIPVPQMTEAQQPQCFERTMAVNEAHQHDGYAPVLHISRVLEGYLEGYLEAFAANDRLTAKPAIVLGGVMPNRLRA